MWQIFIILALCMLKYKSFFMLTSSHYNYHERWQFNVKFDKKKLKWQIFSDLKRLKTYSCNLHHTNCLLGFKKYIYVLILYLYFFFFKYCKQFFVFRDKSSNLSAVPEDFIYLIFSIFDAGRVLVLALIFKNFSHSEWTWLLSKEWGTFTM